jgi:hypothetical protein
MKKHFMILGLILLFVQNNSAQIFCIPPDQPHYPDLAARAGLSMSFSVRFDVVNLSATNIQISTLDSVKNEATMIELFSSSIIGYLSRLCFLRDIKSYTITFEYEVRPHNSINRDYVEMLDNSKIRIIGRRPRVESIGSKDCYCKEGQ